MDDKEEKKMGGNLFALRQAFSFRSIYSSSSICSTRTTIFSQISRTLCSSSSVSSDTKQPSVARLPFVDAFLGKIKNNKTLLANRKIYSRRSTIFPDFVDQTLRIYNGKNFVRCKITEGKVGLKFGEFALTRKRKLLRNKAELQKRRARNKHFPPKILC
ncbi:ribosomal protein S19, mitochondrial-like isoform X2 [Hibiscus syriacus]|nr:ribosomal protein S19, mitochondrial-like isoform X2 [Hibiscus syriacus]